MTKSKKLPQLQTEGNGFYCQLLEFVQATKDKVVI